MLHCFIISFHLLPQKKIILLSGSLKMIQIYLLKRLVFHKSGSSIKKTPPVKVEGFQISFFDLIQTSKIAFTNNC